jgi:hypothetical protein
MGWLADEILSGTLYKLLTGGSELKQQFKAQLNFAIKLALQTV